MEIPLRFKKLRPDAKTPTKNKSDDAGWDFYSPTEVRFEAGQDSVKIKTGIAVDTVGIELPPPFSIYLRAASRSGNAWKRGIEVGAGVVDKGYNGEIGILLHRFGRCDNELVLPLDCAVAQIIPEVIIKTRLEEVDELTESDRGSAGYGSSDRSDVKITPWGIC